MDQKNKSKPEPAIVIGDKVFIGIGGRIKYLRGDESLSSFAQKLGVHKNTLARYEKGESLPDVGFVSMLCDLIDDEFVTPSWLIEGEGPPPDPAYVLAHEELRERIRPMSDLETAKKSVVKHRLDISPENLVKYIEGTYHPTDKELKSICSVFLYSPDLVVSRRKPKELVHSQDNPADRLYRAEIVKEVLIVVEECLGDIDLSLPVDKKAELVTIVYENVYDGKFQGTPLREIVQRLLKLMV